jgi:hypothetical protein
VPGHVFASGKIGLVGARALACAAGLALSAPAAAFPPGVRAVRQGAPAGGDGLSWATAFNDLQPALTAAAADPSVTEIWVAEGTYYTASPGGPPTASFAISNFAVYGGFAGTETAREQRDIIAHPTRLSNDIDRSGTTTEPDTDTTCTLSGGRATRLDGFVITGFRLYRSGAPVRLTGSGTIARCDIRGRGESSGQGALWAQCEPGASIENCYVSGGSFWDGGVYISGAVRIVDSYLHGGSSSGGPGLFIEDATLVRAAVSGSSDAPNPVWIQHLDATDSQVIGAGYQFSGTAVFIGDAVIVRGLLGGSTDTGGVRATSLIARDCTIHAAGGQGVGAWLEHAELTNVRFDGSGYAGSLRVGSGFIEQCTITTSHTNNWAQVRLGPGVEVTGSVVRASGGPRMVIAYEPGASGAVNYSCISNWDGSLGGIGNFGDDPMLDADGRLLPGSPCIDAGPVPPFPLPPYDKDGGCRVTDGNGDGVFRADVGAFETRQCPVNLDCSTGAPLLDTGDLLAFIELFRAHDGRANCDGSTIPPMLNVLDFNCFLNRFAAGCP